MEFDFAPTGTGLAPVLVRTVTVPLLLIAALAGTPAPRASAGVQVMLGTDGVPSKSVAATILARAEAAKARSEDKATKVAKERDTRVGAVAVNAISIGRIFWGLGGLRRDSRVDAKRTEVGAEGSGRLKAYACAKECSGGWGKQPAQRVTDNPYSDARLY